MIYARGGLRAHREHEDGTEHQMDDESTCSLRRKIADRDLVAVDEELERLHHDVSDEERAERLSGRVARHPVDDAEADQRRADVTREHFRRRPDVRDRTPPASRSGEDEQRESEEERSDAADMKSKARAHGAESSGRRSRSFSHEQTSRLLA